MDPPVAELVVKESNVAMWHLQKRTVWVEIKQRIFKIVPVISLIEKARPVGGAVHAFEKSTSTAANVVQYTFNNATIGLPSVLVQISQDKFRYRGQQWKCKKECVRCWTVVVKF